MADSLYPVRNLHGGAKHLRCLLKAYDNDISLALVKGDGVISRHSILDS